MSEKSNGQSRINVLVYGWYHQGNLGDDLFVEAFCQLFPEFNFTFTDHITLTHLEGVDVVFIGGGSFLGEKPNFSEEALTILPQKKILYIGVGTETALHPTHVALMKIAKLIAPRTESHLDKIQEINSSTMVIPDLVYSLSPTFSAKLPQSILILPNVVVIPKWSDPHWKHTAWEHFKNELAQTLDELVEQNFHIKFLPLCVNIEQDDSSAAREIINRMCHRDTRYLLDKKDSLGDVTEVMSKYSIIVTQRYHGIVLANMVKTPCLTIHHHDKLKNTQGFSLSYYETSKNKLLQQINVAIESKVSEVLPIDRNIFNGLKQAVAKIIL